MIERLPEPTRTAAMRPSWPERDQTVLAPPTAEQFYLRPLSRSPVQDGEHRIDDSVLRSRRSLGAQGERRAMTSVHRCVHYWVHRHLAVNFRDQKEMQWNKSRHSDTDWLGVGLERPRFLCHEMCGGRSSPTTKVARRVMWSSPCNFTALHVTADFTRHQRASSYQRPRLTNCGRGTSTRHRSGTRRERPGTLPRGASRISPGRSRLASLGSAMSSAPRAEERIQMGMTSFGVRK